MHNLDWIFAFGEPFLDILDYDLNIVAYTRLEILNFGSRNQLQQVYIDLHKAEVKWCIEYKLDCAVKYLNEIRDFVLKNDFFLLFILFGF